MSLMRLWAISRKETIQLRRDSRSMMLAFLLPIILIIFFGYAISYDVTNIRMAVLDRSQTQQSRAFVEAFESSGYFRVTEYLSSYADVDSRLGRGTARLALVIPPNFSRDLNSRRPAPVQLILDGGDANTATIAKNYAEAIVARFSVATLSRGAEISIPIQAETRIWYNETLESRNMVVPGLIAVIMSVIAANVLPPHTRGESLQSPAQQILAKDEANEKTLASVMYHLAEGLRIVSVLLVPFTIAVNWWLIYGPGLPIRTASAPGVRILCN